MMKCKQCKTELFLITEISDCDKCEHNGWHNGEGYRYDTPPKGTLRDQVEQEGECNLSHAFGAGCWIFTCFNCGEFFNMPTMED